MSEERVIAIAEPSWSKGHFETQMYLFLSILMTKNCRLIVLCPEPDKITEWVINNMPEYRDRIISFRFSARSREYGGGRPLLIWRHLSKTVEMAERESGWSVEVVFITFLDTLLFLGLCTLGFKVKIDYDWAGLYFLPKFFRIKTCSLEKFLERIKVGILKRVKNCRGIGILDEGIHSKTTSYFKNHSIFLFPDVTDERLPSCIPEKLAKIREAAGSRTIIGLVGVLNKRKGLLTYLRSMQSIDHSKCYFLVVGHLPAKEYATEELEEIKELMAGRNREDCHFELDYIDNPMEVNAYIMLCDVLYLCYEGFYHSSGIMTKAVVFRKPMIAAKGYCMGERVERYGFGLTVPEGNVSEVAEAFRTLSDEEARKRIIEEAQFDQFSDFHNSKQLEVVLCKMLGVGI